MAERESMEFDVLIVGGGPAGLAAGIRLKQLAAEKDHEISVCVIEKGAEIGAHAMSGAVLDPGYLTELIPDWKEKGAPVKTKVSSDAMGMLTATKLFTLPGFMTPGCFHNDGNYVIRFGHLVKWLGEQAEEMGVEVYPGFAGAEILYDEKGAVRGVATGDMGVLKNGERGPAYQPGMELLARYTLFAEGCRGHLGKQLETKYNLRNGVDPQTYGIGIKELWEIKPEQHQAGKVLHTAGWPLDNATYGGSFIYHLDDNLLQIGFVVGLAYENPYLSPFEEFNRFKTHPAIRKMLEGGKRLQYGARALTAGGPSSLPKLVFPGGALIGDDAGFLNAPRIKGIHTAIKSGSLAAEAAFDAVVADRRADELTAYPEAYRNSKMYTELHAGRNFKPLMHKGFMLGSLLFGIDQMLFRGKAPWTLHNTADHLHLKKASECQPIDYPKPDGVITFDRLSSVFLSNANHEEDQPCHLQLIDPSLAIRVNYDEYASPETRYCPAGVYEIVQEGDKPQLQINAANCVHCKTCDIKDPRQNINWVVPQGREGPIYEGM